MGAVNRRSRSWRSLAVAVAVFFAAAIAVTAGRPSPALHHHTRRSSTGSSSCNKLLIRSGTTSTDGGGGTTASAAALRRRLVLQGPGSSPPTCRARCGRCTPCRAVRVAIQPGRIGTQWEYYPEVWRCKCGGKLFMP